MMGFSGGFFVDTAMDVWFRQKHKTYLLPEQLTAYERPSFQYVSWNGERRKVEDALCCTEFTVLKYGRLKTLSTVPSSQSKTTV